MAGCVALALVFLRTNCEAVASHIVIPQNTFQLDYIRPDFAMLRLVARCLIMWDSIEASEAWIDSQIPTFLTQLELDVDAASSSLGVAKSTPEAERAGSVASTPRSDVTPPLATRTLHQQLLTPPIAGTPQQYSPPPPPVLRGAAAAFNFLTPSPVQGHSTNQFGALGPSGWAGNGDGGGCGGGGAIGGLSGLSLRGVARGLDFTPRGQPNWTEASEVDWLLVGQTRASLIAGACLSIGLRFAGTADTAAKGVLISRLRAFRDARRSSAHPALIASLPTRGMDLDRSTLETCQSTTAMALGMVMAGTGDLDSLRILRSLRKRADLDTNYAVHMATHTAIGFVFLGGGRYTFDREPLSVAALLMAAFPRFPTSLTDNRCHLQAFRHLYVLAARHRCVEAVDVDTRRPADVKVCLETSRGSETVSLPRLLLADGQLQALSLRSEHYWPVTICRTPSSPPTLGAIGAVSGAQAVNVVPASDRWMRSLESSRRLYVKRRSGHHPQPMGANDDAWFPCFAPPRPRHLERLLLQGSSSWGRSVAPATLTTMVGGSAVAASTGQVEVQSGGCPLRVPGGIALAWLRQLRGAELSTRGVASVEWAAALCCEPADPLPPGVYDFDFEDSGGNDEEGEGDGSLCERFAALLLDNTRERAAYEVAKREDSGCTPVATVRPISSRCAHWLHECVVESKLVAFPMYQLLFAQTRHVAEDCLLTPALALRRGPASPACSSTAVDQMLVVEHFFKSLRARIGASGSPLISEDFLAERCAAVRDAFDEGPLVDVLHRSLRAHQSGGIGHSITDSAVGSDAVAKRMIDEAAIAASTAPAAVAVVSDVALVALYSRLHGLPTCAIGRLAEIIGAVRRPGGEGAKCVARDSAEAKTHALRMLPKLRRTFPKASARGLRSIATALAAPSPRQHSSGAELS
eukprot:TRINITY_DN34546_c0_g2_i1.p1 TRINITY_DN34546_c0_g2~~TRINITY_DN34546_c0_g2_i1.p1  ORF type:complete len:1076 (-),score=190.18 TRINITY_DN34546_c0_g2_i1:260-3019(-)